MTETLPDHELVRRAKAVLTIRHSPETVAERLAVAPDTLKQYAVERGKAAHRPIPGFRLEKLLELARKEMFELGLDMQTAETSTEHLVTSAVDDLFLARSRAGAAVERAEDMMAIPMCPEYHYREFEYGIAEHLRDSVIDVQTQAFLDLLAMKQARIRQFREDEANIRGEEFIE